MRYTLLVCAMLQNKYFLIGKFFRVFFDFRRFQEHNEPTLYNRLSPTFSIFPYKACVTPAQAYSILPFFSLGSVCRHVYG